MSFPVFLRRLPAALSLGLLLCGTSVLSQQAETEPPPTSWSSKEAGVRVTLPRSWSMQSQPGTPPLILRERTGRAVMGVMIEPLPEGGDTPVDLDELTDGALAAHRKSVEKFKLLSRQAVKVDGEPAVEVLFKGKQSGQPYKWIQTLFVSGGHKVYVLYSAPNKLYMGYLGDYDQLVRSIRLTR